MTKLSFVGYLAWQRKLYQPLTKIHWYEILCVSMLHRPSIDLQKPTEVFHCLTPTEHDLKIYFRLFWIAIDKYMHSRNFADVGIRTTDFWCQKWPLCQLRHNQMCRFLKMHNYPRFTILLRVVCCIKSPRKKVQSQSGSKVGVILYNSCKSFLGWASTLPTQFYNFLVPAMEKNPALKR